MLNNKGFYTSTVILLTLLVSVALMSLFTSPVLNSLTDVVKIDTFEMETINRRNAYERLYSNLIENPSLDGNVLYEDIGESFVIKELDTKYKKIVKTGKNINLDIKNKTDISLIIDMNSYDNLTPASFELITTGVFESKLNNSYNNITSNSYDEIIISPEEVYDKATNKTMYGMSNIKLLSTNGDGNLTLTYNELEMRTIEIISNDGVIRTIQIVIDANGVKVNEKVQ